ncbi:fimbrillin family protein [uncultured Bacteroides sp.]|uniref:fimbrillin family protein n=1 Tax=uncultured Bacteroides sp. TaxID=162156 RepID=UPI002629A1DA|nr:fimbrillin family protein [uncultured Bacteroides sp.]
MNKRLHIIHSGLLAILLAVGSGCGDNGTPLDEAGGNGLMTFNVLHPREAAGATSRVTSTAFENGDRVGLFISRQDAPLEVSGNYVNNAALTFNGSEWTPDRPVYWDGGSYDIYAYYPRMNSVSSVDNLPFSVSLDQNDPGSADRLGGYEASDFLWACQMGASAGDAPVSLQFAHRMSRMLIRLVKGEDFEGEMPADAEVYIHNTVPEATIDLSVGIVTRNPYGTRQSIRALSMGNHTYSAIIVPQRLDNRQPLVEVIMKGVSYLYESKFVFKQGIQHSVQLVVSKNPEQIKIEVGGELENWDE